MDHQDWTTVVLKKKSDKKNNQSNQNNQNNQSNQNNFKKQDNDDKIQIKKVSKQNILKARINTLNRKIKEVNFNNIYSEKIQIITEDAMKNLELWKNLELKYKSFKKIKVNKDKKQFYKEKVKLYNLKIQQSLSALMIIFANLKNLN